MKVIKLLCMILVTGSLVSGPFVNNPRKMAQEQAARAFKTSGVHIRGIVGNVNEVQDEIERIKKMMDELQRAIYAPRSPFSRLPRMVNSIEQFKQNVAELQRVSADSDVERLLGGESGRDEVFKTISDKRQKLVARTVYDQYDALLFEMDMVVIHAIMHHMRQMVYDVAGMLDSVAHIRDYGGTFSNEVINLDEAQQMRLVANALRALARKLTEIMQGGTRSMKDERESLAGALLKHGDQFGSMISTMQESSSAINSIVHAMQTDLMAMTKAKDNLIRSATFMQKRLTQVLLKAQKGSEGADLNVVGHAEIQAMMVGLHDPIIMLLGLTADLLQKMTRGLQDGLTGINAFKTYINFDVVNPVVRLDLDALPDLMRELSRAVTQLRGAMN